MSVTKICRAATEKERMRESGGGGQGRESGRESELRARVGECVFMFDKMRYGHIPFALKLPSRLAREWVSLGDRDSKRERDREAENVILSAQDGESNINGNNVFFAVGVANTPTLGWSGEEKEKSRRRYRD